MRAGELSPLPVQLDVLVAYAVDFADGGKSMSTIRLAVAAIVDAHRRVGLESPQTDGVTETLRGRARQIGVRQKQARPLDAEDGAGLVYIERSKTDQAGEGAVAAGEEHKG